MTATVKRRVERTLSTGTRIRLTVEPAPNACVRILKYERRPKGSMQWRRSTRHEGLIVPFADLGFSMTFADVFQAPTP